MNTRIAPAARVPDRTLWIDGRLARGADATLSVFDRGARDGGGVFETLRVYGGQPFAFERHMERMVLAAAELGFPVPPAPAVLRAALGEVLEANALADAVVRITVTRGVAGGRPTRTGAWIDAEPLGGRLWRGTRRGAGDAILSPTPFEPGALGRWKTTSRLAWDLAREQARAADADETILVTPEGHVLAGAASNIFVFRDDEILTPPLSQPILPGVTRAIVLELCAELRIRTRALPIVPEHLRWAEEIWLTNSVQELLPLATLDRREVPSRDVGAKVLAAYRERVNSGA